MNPYSALSHPVMVAPKKWRHAGKSDLSDEPLDVRFWHERKSSVRVGETVFKVIGDFFQARHEFVSPSALPRRIFLRG